MALALSLDRMTTLYAYGTPFPALENHFHFTVPRLVVILWQFPLTASGLSLDLQIILCGYGMLSQAPKYSHRFVVTTTRFRQFHFPLIALASSRGRMTTLYEYGTPCRALWRSRHCKVTRIPSYQSYFLQMAHT